MTSYLTQADAVSFIAKLNPNLTADDIPEDFIDAAEARLEQDLVRARIAVPATDHADFLHFGTLFYLIDFLSQFMKLAHSPGRLSETKLGAAGSKFAREGMFFMRSGEAGRAVADLMQSQTPHQTARFFVRSYISWYWRNNEPEENTTKTGMSVTIAHDKTSFGHGWNIDDDEVADADEASKGGW